MTDSSINQAMSAIMVRAEGLTLFSPIRRGPLDAEAGISMELTAGSAPKAHMDGRLVAKLSLTFSAKHCDMQLASNTLHRILEDLSNAEFPQTDQWQITDISIETMPHLIRRDPGNLWLFTSSLTVTLYY